MEKCDCEWHNFVKKQYEESDKPLSSHAVLCEVCAYWLEDPEFNRMGSCGNDDVNSKLCFGHADYFLISADFGCKYFKKK
jgi:hypothetical protein